MIILKQPADISSHVEAIHQHTVTGFVPTMGALHAGHLELLKSARRETGLVIASIFVNPAQFNDPKDFEKYPHPVENDILLLEKAGCDILFLPSVQSIYPNGIDDNIKYDLGYLEKELEGRYRPGHFQGVCKVVHRLLDIINPGKLYLGQKDFQQCMVIKKLIELTGIDTEIVICPTQREANGLAMSSRNMRLNAAEREKAKSIYEALLWIRQNIDIISLPELKQSAAEQLTNKGFKVDYVEIASANNLGILKTSTTNAPMIALAAAFLDEVRLIDNMMLVK